MSVSPSPSSVRAVAIQKLKRAASLPRMKDGRRPGIPANGGAFSEGGRSQDASQAGDESPLGSADVSYTRSDTPQTAEASAGTVVDLSSEETFPEVSTPAPPPPQVDTPALPDPPLPKSPIPPTPPPTVQAVEVPPSPPLSPSTVKGTTEDEEPLEEPVEEPPPQLPVQAALLLQQMQLQRALAMSPTFPPSAFSPVLISPTPQSYQDLMMAAQASMPSIPPTPAQRFYVPPTSPVFPMSHPASPLPSLQELQSSYQRGLFRSNSAAARSEAWYKLTGGRETPLTSPPSTPGQVKLGRSNTVTGGERLATRGRMMDVLDRRRKEAAENASAASISVAELTSAGEDSTFEKSKEERKSRRRRRHSASKSVIVDDRDMPTNAPNTPAAGATPLPPPEEVIPPLPPPPEDIVLPPVPRPDSVSSHAASFQRHSLERNRDSALARLMGEDKFEYDIPVPDRRSKAVNGVRAKSPLQQPPVEEPKSPRPLPPIPQTSSVSGQPYPRTPSMSGLPYPNPPFRYSGRVHHGSDAPSNVSSGGYTDLGIPFVFKEGSLDGRHDSFPVTVSGSPFGTPYKSPRPMAASLEATPDKAAAKSSGDEASNQTPWYNEWSEPEVAAEAHEKLQPEEPGLVDKAVDLVDEVPLEVPITAVSTALLPSPPVAAKSTPMQPAMSPPRAAPASFPIEEKALPSVPPPSAGRGTFVSEASSTSIVPASTTQRSQSESYTDFEPTTDHDTSAVEEKPRTSRRSPSRIGERVKNLLHTVSSKTGLRPRSNSVTSQQERKEKTGSGHSRDSGGKRDSRENGHLTSASTASLLSQSLPAASKSVLDISLPLPAIGASPMPVLTPALKHRYNDDKLFPFPGMRTLETARQAERDRIRGMSSPTSADGFDQFDALEHADELVEMQPALSGLPVHSPLSSPSPAQNGTSPSEHSQKAITYIDLSPPLPTNRTAVKDWLKAFHLHSPTSSDGGQSNKRKPSLTDLLSSARLTDNASEKEDNATLRGSLGRSLTKKPSTPKLPKVTRPGTAPSAIGASSAKPQTPPSTVSVATTPLVRGQPKARLDNPSSIASDPSGPLTTETLASDPSGSALSTPSQDSQPSVESAEQSAQTKPREATTPTTPSSGNLAVVNTQPVSFHLRPLAPRKIMLHSTVLQVVRGDVLKERCLFLFTDILVIAKPIGHLPEVIPGKDMMLERPMRVKSVVDLRQLHIKKRELDVGQTSADKLQPAMRAFVEEFARNPGTAVEKMAREHDLLDDPAATADVLFETPALDKAQLGEYLAQRSVRHVLRAYIDRFGFEDVRVDVALRTFLLSIRLPEDQGGLEHLLETFANRWWEANSRMNGFDKESAQRLVAAMMQLSDALHSDSYFGPFGGVNGLGKKRISVDDWIDAFRARDPRQLVPEVMLRKIFYNIRSFRLAEALDVSQSDAEVPAAMIPPKIRTRLTHSEPSERITVRIPRPDRNFAIRLYGHGMKFDPEFLDFSNATEQSFVIIPSAVGVKTVIFGREGVNSPLYTGLPLSKTFLVERAFMQNTFQLAFVNHLGVKRKYLYSMEDPFLLDKWTDTLTSQITKRQMTSSVMSPETERRMAADAIACTLLRDTLLSNEPSPLSSSAELRGGSRASTTQTPPAKDGEQDKRILGKELLHVCIQNSLLPGMILRHRPNKNEDSSQSETGRLTPRSRTGTPVARPQTIRVM